MKLFKKSDLIVILLLCAGAILYLLYPGETSDRLYAEIYHHNELVQRISLDASGGFPGGSSDISSDSGDEASNSLQEPSAAFGEAGRDDGRLHSRIIKIGEVTIEISQEGAVSFIHSDCPDQVCVHSGKIHRDGEQIACVPNHILVKIVGVSAGNMSVENKGERLSSSFTGSFNTVSSMVSVGLSESEFKRTAAVFRDELHHLHLLYSIYDDADISLNSSEQPPSSDHKSKPRNHLLKHNLKYINEQGKGEYQIHPNLSSLLLYADEVREITEGKVDITIGGLLKLWHQARETGILPTAHAIEEALKTLTNPKDQSLSRSDGRSGGHYEVRHLGDEHFLHILRDDFTLDVGAIAKGFALDLLCETLSRHISEEFPNKNPSFLISLGGNIKSIGEKSDWVIGIRHPDSNRVFASFVLPKDMAVATSGDYERYMEVDGKRYHHIIDTATGYPAEYGIRSVTVIAKSGALSDALTTALFLMPVEEGLDFAQRQGAEVFYILDNLRVITSDGFPRWKKSEKTTNEDK